MHAHTHTQMVEGSTDTDGKGERWGERKKRRTEIVEERRN